MLIALPICMLTVLPRSGWDRWMRLSTTTRGRECVVPEINRSRHASSHGTNVVDNTPFEVLAF